MRCKFSGIKFFKGSKMSRRKISSTVIKATSHKLVNDKDSGFKILPLFEILLRMTIITLLHFTYGEHTRWPKFVLKIQDHKHKIKHYNLINSSDVHIQMYMLLGKVDTLPKRNT